MKRIAKLTAATGLLCALAGAAAPAASAADNDSTQHKANSPSCELEIAYYDQVFRFPPNCEWPDVPVLNLDNLIKDTINGVIPGSL